MHCWTVSLRAQRLVRWFGGSVMAKTIILHIWKGQGRARQDGAGQDKALYLDGWLQTEKRY